MWRSGRRRTGRRKTTRADGPEAQTASTSLASWVRAFTETKNTLGSVKNARPKTTPCPVGRPVGPDKHRRSHVQDGPRASPAGHFYSFRRFSGTCTNRIFPCDASKPQALPWLLGSAHQQPRRLSGPCTSSRRTSRARRCSGPHIRSGRRNRQDGPTDGTARAQTPDGRYLAWAGGRMRRCRRKDDGRQAPGAKQGHTIYYIIIIIIYYHNFLLVNVVEKATECTCTRTLPQTRTPARARQAACRQIDLHSILAGL